MSRVSRSLSYRCSPSRSSRPETRCRQDIRLIYSARMKGWHEAFFVRSSNTDDLFRVVSDETTSAFRVGSGCLFSLTAIGQWLPDALIGADRDIDPIACEPVCRSTRWFQGSRSDERRSPG